MKSCDERFLRARQLPLELVIFDCDGVLIDSEALCNRVVAEILTEAGWSMTAEECNDRFIGSSFYAMQPQIEAHLGRSLGDDWVDRVVELVTEGSLPRDIVEALRAADVEVVMARAQDGVKNGP